MNKKTLYFDNYEKMISALGEGIRRVNSEFKSVKRSLINRDHECTPYNRRVREKEPILRRNSVGVAELYEQKDAVF